MNILTEAQLGMARCYKKKDNVDKSIELCKKVLVLELENIECNIILAECYQSEGLLRESIALYKKNIKLIQLTVPHIFEITGRHHTKTAEVLGISKRCLYDKLRWYNIIDENQSSLEIPSNEILNNTKKINISSTE